jgi:hypothetical protein
LEDDKNIVLESYVQKRYSNFEYALDQNFSKNKCSKHKINGRWGYKTYMFGDSLMPWISIKHLEKHLTLFEG